MFIIPFINHTCIGNCIGTGCETGNIRIGMPTLCFLVTNLCSHFNLLSSVGAIDSWVCIGLEVSVEVGLSVVVGFGLNGRRCPIPPSIPAIPLYIHAIVSGTFTSKGRKGIADITLPMKNLCPFGKTTTACRGMDSIIEAFGSLSASMMTESEFSLASFRLSWSLSFTLLNWSFGLVMVFGKNIIRVCGGRFLKM